MSVAKGEGTKDNVDKSGDSALSGVSLSRGEGKASESTLYGNDATLTTQQEFVVAKGDGAHATLDYTSSELTTGSAVIASGNNATADVELKRTSVRREGEECAAMGTSPSTPLTHKKKSPVNAQGAMSVAKDAA
ncbi:hypothetical protein, partial [Escherichia coli]|uniref:hypothetical protein n=1 Tax=Escherichia coli TaxID=562 RepID=UPI003D815837